MDTTCLGVVAVRVHKVLVILHSDHEACEEDAMNVSHRER
jgi:hypothetical protein